MTLQEQQLQIDQIKFLLSIKYPRHVFTEQQTLPHGHTKIYGQTNSWLHKCSADSAKLRLQAWKKCT